MGAFPGWKGAEDWGGGQEMETGSPGDVVGVRGAEQGAVANRAPNAPLCCPPLAPQLPEGGPRAAWRRGEQGGVLSF